MRLVCFATLLLGAAAYAQQAPGPLSITYTDYAWTQDGASLTEVQGYIYRAYVDQAPAVVLSAQCAATATPTSFSCHAPIGPLVLGTHSTTLTAANQTGESMKSAPPLTFTIVAVPPTPTNLRAGPKPPNRPTTQQQHRGQR